MTGQGFKIGESPNCLGDCYKADPKLKRIPVVVLTTSKNEDDIFQSYDLHVNCYITKSRNLSQLFKIVKGIDPLPSTSCLSH